ncbi:DUF4270 domain-containing protein [Bacteroidota bacterium]
MSFLKSLLLVVCAVVVFNACKDPEGLGLGVLPDGEELPIAWVDTFTVVASTVFQDSVPTSNLSSGTYLIGDFGDPIFGRVRSNLYTQFLLSSSDVDFGSNPKIDSIVVNLPYAGSYGNTDEVNGLQKFGVYKLGNAVKLNDEDTYYSTKEHQLGDMVGSKDFQPDLDTETILGEDTLSPSLRIVLDEAFGQAILNSNNLSSNSAFLSEFKGLALKPENASMNADFGSILYFNMVSTETRVELYYHNDKGAGARFDLLINEDCATHTAFIHDFAAEIENAVTGSTVTGADVLFVQSMAGTKIKLDIPYLRNISELGVVSINKAELIVPLDKTTISDYEPPSRLEIVSIDENGDISFLVDVEEGISFQGGDYNATNKEYVFNIARHLQSLLNAPEKTDYGLYILNSGNSVNARRGVFNGAKHPDRPLKLRLTYTIID